MDNKNNQIKMDDTECKSPKLGEIPYVGFLVYKHEEISGEHWISRGTVTLLDKNTILTAAGNFNINGKMKDKDADQFGVIFGQTDWLTHSSNGVLSYGRRIDIHPSYLKWKQFNKTKKIGHLPHDVVNAAVMKLEKNIIYSDYVGPVKLSNCGLFKPGVLTYCLAYGPNRFHANSGLMICSCSIVPGCSQVLGGFHIAGHSINLSVKDDNGGPVLLMNDQQGVQIGIITNSKSNTFYVKIGEITDWITECLINNNSQKSSKCFGF